MNNIDFTVCFILEQQYTLVYNLPDKWDKIDLKDKCNLLGIALNNKKKIEDLVEYKVIINEIK